MWKKHSVKSCYQQICLICISRSAGTYLQPVRVIVFLYATTVSPIKLIFYTNNKKAVDLKLQIRISRNNSFSRYLIPKRINVTTFVRYYFSSRSKVFCKKGVLRNFKKRLKRDSSGVLPWILRDFLELLFCIWLSM